LEFRAGGVGSGAGRALRAAAERKGVQAERREARGKKLGDGRAQSAEREDRLQRLVRGVGRAGRRGRGNEMGIGGLLRAFLDLAEVGRGREAGIADGLEALDLVAERTREP